MSKNQTIAVIGGTGKAGRYIVQQLLAQGFQIKLLLRHPENFQTADVRAEIIPGDARDIQAVESLLTGCTAVINAIGQTKGEPSVFSEVSRNIVQTMNGINLKRYIVLTGLNVDTPEDQKSAYTAGGTAWMKEHYPLTTADKQVEWAELNASAVNWTLVRLPLIECTEERRPLTIKLTDCPGEKISATSLAVFVVQQLKDESYWKKSPFIADESPVKLNH
jgi:putative NADH-flavin reductase